MKRLTKLGCTLGLASSLFVGMGQFNPRPAQALEEAKVLDRLTAVPVFTLVSDKGAPIFGSDPNDKSKKPIILFFVSQKDAQAALASFKKAQPQQSDKAQVLLLSMKDALTSFKKIKGENDIVYSIEPSAPQLQSAVNILKKNGEIVAKGDKLVTKEGKPFVGGVPLFYATTVDKNGKTGFVTGTQEIVDKGQKKQVPYVPVYFSDKDLQRDLAAVQKQQPDAKVDIKVTMFNNFLAFLYNAKTEAEVPFRLIPSDESAQFANTLLNKAKQAAPKPQQAPKK